MAWSALKSDIQYVKWSFQSLCSLLKSFDTEKLDARIPAPIDRGIKACVGSFTNHWFGRFGQRYINTNICFFALKDTNEISNLRDADIAASLDGKDNLFGFATSCFMEVESAVDASICTFLYFTDAASTAETQRPILKLVFVLFRELYRSFKVCRFSDHLICFANFSTEGCIEAILDKANGEMGNVDADPAAVELLSDLNGSAAAAEWVENYVAFVRGGAENAFERASGF